MKFKIHYIIALIASCFIFENAYAVEVHYGIVRRNLEVVCINHCSDFHLDPDPGDTYIYLIGDSVSFYLGRHVEVIGFRGSCSGCVDIWVQDLTVVPLLSVTDNEQSIPHVPFLDQNYPNPFNPATTIRYAVTERQHVSLKVYNLLGQPVATLVNEEKSPGNYTAAWNADGLPSGVYYSRLEIGKFSSMKKMLLLR